MQEHALEGLCNIQIIQRRCSSRINHTAHKINHRYNHTWIRFALYLRMQHSSSSHNMELRHSLPLWQINQGGVRRSKRGRAAI